MIPNKINESLLDTFYNYFLLAIKMYDKSKSLKDIIIQQKVFKRFAYDFISQRSNTNLFVSHKALSKYPDDYRVNKNLTSDHTLRPSSYFFEMILSPEYRKKYLDKNLISKLLNINTICCRVLKEENRKLQSLNSKSNITCTTKDLYEKANIKVYEYDKPSVDINYYTPAFNLLPIEVQEDITRYENSLIVNN